MRVPYNEFKITVAHEAWRRCNPELKKMGYWKFRRIIQSLGNHVIEEILTNNEGVILPYGLGQFQIVGVKKTTRGKRRRKMELFRTDNVYYKLRWNNSNAKKYLPHALYFKACSTRILRDELVKRIKKDQFYQWTVFNTSKESCVTRVVSKKRLDKLKDIYDDNW